MNSSKKLIIFTHGGGRFTNQLISYGHLIGFLAENKDDFALINMAFWRYAHLLKMTSADSRCTFPTQHNQWKHLEIIKKLFDLLPKKGSGRIWNNIIRILYGYGAISPGVQTIIAKDVSGLNYCLGENIDSLDLANPEDINLLNRAKVTILGGWGVRSWPLFKKHQIKIKNSLALNSEYTRIAEEFIQSLREKYEFLIGVLIRQGDYRLYAQGKYFFDTDQYITWIEQAKELFGASSKVGFVVASDEPQDIDKFKNLDVHFATGIAGGRGHYLESMAELSKCDLIMTPPSTFGVWAAFLEDKPVLPLCETSQVISRMDLLKNHIFEALAHPHLSVAVK